MAMTELDSTRLARWFETLIIIRPLSPQRNSTNSADKIYRNRMSLCLCGFVIVAMAGRKINTWIEPMFRVEESNACAWTCQCIIFELSDLHHHSKPNVVPSWSLNDNHIIICSSQKSRAGFWTSKWLISSCQERSTIIGATVYATHWLANREHPWRGQFCYWTCLLSSTIIRIVVKLMRINCSGLDRWAVRYHAVGAW